MPFSYTVPLLEPPNHHPRPPRAHRYLLIRTLCLCVCVFAEVPTRLNHCCRVFVQVDTPVYYVCWVWLYLADECARWLATEALRVRVSKVCLKKRNDNSERYGHAVVTKIITSYTRPTIAASSVRTERTWNSTITRAFFF